MPDGFEISFRFTRPRCALDIAKLGREAPDRSPTHVSSLKKLAVRNVKRFSCSRQTAEIHASAEGSCVVGDEFALGLPDSILELISKGISHFPE
jgi:hypothetical protein